MSRGHDDDYDRGDDEREPIRRDDDYDDDDRGTRKAKERTNVPGILLIIVGVLNILGALYFTFNGFVVLNAPPELLNQQTNINPEQKKALEQQGWSLEKIMHGAGWLYVAVGIIGALAAIITLVGGIRMRSLRGYGLAVLGSVITLIPFLAPTGCCLLGQVAGIWALVVLLSADVKAAFR